MKTRWSNQRFHNKTYWKTLLNVTKSRYKHDALKWSAPLWYYISPTLIKSCVLRFEFNDKIHSTWLQRRCITYFCFIRIDYIFFLWRNRPTWAYAASLLRFLDCTQLVIHNAGARAHGRTPLDEWSARRRSSYQQNTRKTQGGNIHVLSGIRAHNHQLSGARRRIPLDRTATGISQSFYVML
jgi:hypothetical protein